MLGRVTLITLQSSSSTKTNVQKVELFFVSVLFYYYFTQLGLGWFDIGLWHPRSKHSYFYYKIFFCVYWLSFSSSSIVVVSTQHVPIEGKAMVRTCITRFEMALDVSYVQSVSAASFCGPSYNVLLLLKNGFSINTLHICIVVHKIRYTFFNFFLFYTYFCKTWEAKKNWEKSLPGSDLTCLRFLCSFIIIIIIFKSCCSSTLGLKRV